VIRLSPKTSLPLIVLAVGFVAAGGMIAARPQVSTQPTERLLPLVRVLEAKPQRVQLTIEARGSVVPRTESELVAEVSGRIVWVSPSLASGGFLEPDDIALRIDDHDYGVALVRAESAFARAQSEHTLARASLKRHDHLRKSGVESSAAYEGAKSRAEIAEATRREAEANLDQAKRDLSRTEIRSPFAGRVREKHVDVGQFVARGAPVARIYAVDYAEVRLPIPDADAAFVDLPIAYRNATAEEDGPEVLLRARFAGRDYTWRGRIVRTEGELDPRTRMIQAVVRVEDPYGRGDDPHRPPLSVGLFVEAEILGREVEGVIVLPRSALRGDNEVAIVDARGHLHLRRVEILKRNRETVVIRAGVEPGERVCTSPLTISVEGMEVRVLDDAPPSGLPIPASPARPASVATPATEPASPAFAGYRNAS
jgi:RND family efflux transporter MFP subunit